MHIAMVGKTVSTNHDRWTNLRRYSATYHPCALAISIKEALSAMRYAKRQVLSKIISKVAFYVTFNL